MKIKSLHYFSGLTISIFVGLHLFNHLCSIFSINQHLEIMEMLRKVYRNGVCESILLLAVIIQIISGLALFKRLRKNTVSHFEKLQV